MPEKEEKQRFPIRAFRLETIPGLYYNEEQSRKSGQTRQKVRRKHMLREIVVVGGQKDDK